MARTKYIPNRKPKPKPPQPEESNALRETANRAAWTAVIELGASNGQAMVKKSDGAWELVRWAQGAGASRVGGAEAIPALTAIRKGGQEPREIRHGHAAVRARKGDSTGWEIFAYPKFVFMDEGATPDIQQTLELQKEKAKSLGTTSREVAIGFFQHMISEVVGLREDTVTIHINISDRWRNRNVQELMLSFQSLRDNVYFEHVDECLSTLVGRIAGRKSSFSDGEVVVVVDCGHSTMNVGFAEIAEGPTYNVRRYEEYSAGAGVINMAVEDEVRNINRANGSKFVDTNVWEVSEFIDEYFKPEPGSKLTARYGFTEPEWDMIMGRAALANRTLDRRRLDHIRQTLIEAKDMADSTFQVLLTGRGSRSPTFRKDFEKLLSEEYPLAKMQEDKETHSTAVLGGLMRISDDPGILSVKEVPVSLWLRSDSDETTNEENQTTVVRICTQGKDTNDKASIRDRVSASHPIHYELSTVDDGPLSLDLSVFGTPAGLSDSDVLEGWNAERFAYTNIHKVTEFGRFEHQMPASAAMRAKKVFHVYLYVEVSRLSVKFYAVFARDGHQVKALEKTAFRSAFQTGQITEKWKKHRGIEMQVVRLKQVARSETLSVNAQESSVSTNQQAEPFSHSNSPSNIGPVQEYEIQTRHKATKRPSSLPMRSQARRRKLLTPATGSAKPSSDLPGNSGEETESEMEL